MLFRKDIEPMCSYCQHGTKLNDMELSCKYRASHVQVVPAAVLSMSLLRGFLRNPQDLSCEV